MHCSYCGFNGPPPLHGAASFCPRCGSALADPVARAKPVNPQTENGIRPPVALAIATAGCLLLIACVWLRASGDVQREKIRMQNELSASDLAYAAEVAAAHAAEVKRISDERARHEALLNDRQLFSGEKARKRHADEWTKRLAHDPAIAVSSLEKNLLKMEQLGRDPALAAKVALQEVALMALPPGSRVEVIPAGEKFLVRTAFKMSAVSKHEKGAVTKHHSTASMRREIEELSARLFQDLFDYCGSRGIERVTVACNHTTQSGLVPAGATPRERQQILRTASPVMMSLYRVRVDASKLAAAGNWRNLTIPQIIPLMAVERDGLQTLSINSDISAEAEDVDMPLEF
jgi:hypothetical protein